MPVIVDPDSGSVRRLLGALPPGCQSVDSIERLLPWLSQHTDEYVIVLGPNVRFDDAVTVCEGLRVSRPMMGWCWSERASTRRRWPARCRPAPARWSRSTTSTALRARSLAPTSSRWPCAARGRPNTTGRVIAVFSPKGGVGKTTIAVNLALALTDKGNRQVCLVDFDLAFGDVAITLQLFPTHTIEHAIGSENNVDVALLESLLARYQDSLKVLPAPSHPDVRERISPTLIQQTLTTLRTMFDYVVVDTAPAFDEQTLTVLEETDESRDHRDARRADPEERQGRPRHARDAQHRPRPPPPAAQPGGRRGRHRRPEGGVDPGHGDLDPDHDVHRHRGVHQLRGPDPHVDPQPPVQRGHPQPGGDVHRGRCPRIRPGARPSRRRRR